LEDLANANLQLTRLNTLAQALRNSAEEARKTKELLVANISHELRTPLNMIIGFCEMIVQAPDVYSQALPRKLMADLDVILRNSQHLSRLVDDVLDLSQIDAGEMALTRERVSLEEVIDSAAVAVRPLFESKGLYLKHRLAPDLPQVFCDSTRICQVVINLLSNAGRFTSQGGVTICARREDGDVVVSVSDTGPGIRADAQKDIFQPFHQMDDSIRRRYGSSGLGLSVSHKFIELHGGQIWFESDEGKGTTFFFKLPIDAPMPEDGTVLRWFSPYSHYEERTRRSLAPVPVERPRFVVWEHGSSLERMIRRYVDGAEVVSTTTLHDAIQELNRVPARALLINTTSVGETLDVVIHSAALPYGTPAIICSIPSTQSTARSIGVSDYLVKPVSRDVLLGTTEELAADGATLLVIDDEPDALRLFRRMLASSPRGYRVLTANSGEKGLNVLKEYRPDAVFLDLVMDSGDGFWFLKQQALDPTIRDIPVIIVSARDPEGQPIVTNAIALTRGGELSVRQLLDCIQEISLILSAGAERGGRESKSTAGG
jgi:nitrogen-specific signal transduction histidine kinase/CheY-like chemotaxis protein